MLHGAGESCRILYKLAMNFRFEQKDTLRLFLNDDGPMKKALPPEVTQRFFAAMDNVLAADDERDLRRVPGYHFEKVPSEGEGCYSIRLGKQFRLIFRLHDEAGEQTLEVVDVRDYH